MELTGRRFLITGGFSLIGSHIAEQVLAAGAAEVVLLDNAATGSPASVEHLVPGGRVRIVRGDILRMDQVLQALEGVDGVFHTAALLTLGISRDPWAGVDVNVRGLMTVLEACRWRAVRRLIYSSSVAVYGNALGEIVTEETPFLSVGVQPVAALYATSKLMGEQLCALYRERHGVDGIALRYSTVYGERQHARGVNVLHILEAYDRIRQGQPPVIPGDGREVHDYVYAGDVARANLLAMGSDCSGEAFTIATGVATSLEELVRILLRLTGSALAPEYRPDGGRVRSAGATEMRFSREKAAARLGWTPEVSIEEGLRRLVAWREATTAGAAPPVKTQGGS
ncbi:MAG: NAD-dependent epimerase/dehydratase family protein [Candidatus Rokubacteria bacterium]|nr:NAD-dependent epimerase/dehydratase family protein [Candidatus Rokubacteria bacterium]MBI3107347.1 NAD-dependent epimerase/dehydratase family protein [Candidatus Rokubacteria bacterium]